MVHLVGRYILLVAYVLHLYNPGSRHVPLAQATHKRKKAVKHIWYWAAAFLKNHLGFG
jgi:hypothetical protein